jgi:CRISPR-associated endonuclease/helicase Cas3
MFGSKIPEVVDLPTGLGKTSVIAIWLLALSAQAVEGSVSLPRRLVYVVDRRTVVDQSTDVAIGISPTFPTRREKSVISTGA